MPAEKNRSSLFEVVAATVVLAPVLSVVQSVFVVFQVPLTEPDPAGLPLVSQNSVLALPVPIKGPVKASVARAQR